ncbi:hypothetical protein Pmani_026737 [Petrolisthes manimaculis]|uniref:Uncharacterized protein n=1 Tax=Petrolisthes manimaculis TaxID=1843537 RepID=A0AAE1TXJ3_9EUCA|nr:hypothetical protein Pmani_026737 [Petrolisthes manimaculis]
MDDEQIATWVCNVCDSVSVVVTSTNTTTYVHPYHPKLPPDTTTTTLSYRPLHPSPPTPASPPQNPPASPQQCTTLNENQEATCLHNILITKSTTLLIKSLKVTATRMEPGPVDHKLDTYDNNGIGKEKQRTTCHCDLYMELS